MGVKGIEREEEVGRRRARMEREGLGSSGWAGRGGVGSPRDSREGLARRGGGIVPRARALTRGGRWRCRPNRK